MKLSCTSVMLPRWTLDETFDKLAAYGYDGVELRCRYNPEGGGEPAFWGHHRSDVSPDNVVEKAAQIRAAAARSGVQVVALAPNCLLHETELVHKLFKGAVAIDPEQPPMVRIGAPKYEHKRSYISQFLEARAGFANLVEMARPYGVKVLYEIHVGTVALTASRATELLRDLDPAHIGAIYDVPNMVRVGLEDTRMGLELLGSYLAHCHIGNGILVVDGQDRTGAQQWKWEFCDLRTGVAAIAQIVQDLKDVGYDGCLSLEEFSPDPDDEKLKKEGEYLRQLIG